jgi:hypothetical protein
MPLTNGSGSCYRPSRRQQKTYFKKSFSVCYFFEDTSFFKDKKSKRSRKTIGITVFFYYFCLTVERSGAESGSVTPTNGSGFESRRPKNMILTDPDPDPQHCFLPCLINYLVKTAGFKLSCCRCRRLLLSTTTTRTSWISRLTSRRTRGRRTFQMPDEKNPLMPPLYKKLYGLFESSKGLTYLL